MLSRPPKTEFYANDEHAQLWLWDRVLSLYGKYKEASGVDNAVFLRVLSDFANELDPSFSCPEGHGPCVNVSVDGVHYQCLTCKWEPIRIEIT